MIINVYYVLEHCLLHDWEQWDQWTNIQQFCGSQTRTQKIKARAKYGGELCKDRFNCPNEDVNSICISQTRNLSCPG